MVQMKMLMKNFVTKRYKKFSQRKFSNKSFFGGIIAYVVLLGTIVIGRWSGNQDNFFNQTMERFLNIQILGIFIMIGSIAIGYFLFKLKAMKKFAVLICYFSGVLYLFFIGAFLACLTEDPFRLYFYGCIFVLLGWLIGILLQIVLVKISLRRGSMKIRDDFGDYYVNTISAVGILFFLYSEISGNDLSFYIGVSLAFSALLIVATFNFPRILPYWRKEDTKKDVSVYGNTTKMMKRGKSK
ncbi:hypothetical protein ACQ3MN_07795 [Enterococcus faecalis]|uniref:hypothetical protein n=1 Tax=Enterococcus faecalis TaxID=1351 RepID=UPI003D771188